MAVYLLLARVSFRVSACRRHLCGFEDLLKYASVAWFRNSRRGWLLRSPRLPTLRPRFWFAVPILHMTGAARAPSFVTGQILLAARSAEKSPA